MIVCPICAVPPCGVKRSRCRCGRFFVREYAGRGIVFYFRPSLNGMGSTARYIEHETVDGEGLTDASAFVLEADAPGVEAAVAAAVRIAVAHAVMGA